eukprot:1044240_1
MNSRTIISFQYNLFLPFTKKILSDNLHQLDVIDGTDKVYTFLWLIWTWKIEGIKRLMSHEKSKYGCRMFGCSDGHQSHQSQCHHHAKKLFYRMQYVSDSGPIQPMALKQYSGRK